MLSSSSLNISAIDLVAAFDTAYAPQKALPLLATPDDVNIILGEAEDPSLLKGPQELQKCYEWFFSKESEITNDHYFTFDSFKEL